MLLTAMAVVVGSAVMLADPIFQGLALSLVAGEIASLLISRMAVPVLYFMVNQKKHNLCFVIPQAWPSETSSSDSAVARPLLLDIS
jgi:hypothetical protein